MSDFMDRLLEERNQLSDRLTKLTDFIDTPKYRELPEEQRSLLRDQHGVMEQYLRILAQRILLLSAKQD